MASKLEPYIDNIIESIIEGKRLREIADTYKCALSTLHEFLASSEHSARYNAALAQSAGTYADKGEQVLLEAEKDKIEIQRARELAQHYRWMAGKRNPGAYGNRVDVTSGGEKIQQPVISIDPLKEENDGLE